MGMNSMAPLLLLIGLSCCLTAGYAQQRESKEKSPHPLPRADLFSRLVIKVMRSYPTDGSHPYFWPRKKKDQVHGWAGNTRELRYRGGLLSRKHPRGCCYCCGLTFEVFYRAWQAWCSRTRRSCRIKGLDLAGLKQLRRHWFGANGDLTCLAGAITKAGLGREVPLKAARPGDFVQFWRHSGSGHSVIFLSWKRDKEGTLTGLTYWSTQTSTKGIGRRVEKIGPKGIDSKRIHIARVGLPLKGRQVTGKKGNTPKGRRGR